MTETKDTLLAIMRIQLPAIIEQWNDYGIIIETQFDFATQSMFKRFSKDAYEIICSNGGYAVYNPYDAESDERFPITSACKITGEGYMYYFFDPERVDCEDAHKMVRNYFAHKESKL